MPTFPGKHNKLEKSSPPNLYIPVPIVFPFKTTSIQQITPIISTQNDLINE